ncbi:MAG: 23S rRNA (adenine(2503)-C(2))-methyltransferase RlmN, partial [Hungatella sp.]
MMIEKKDIKSLNLEELTGELRIFGAPAFRAKQIYEWIHVKLAESFDEMTNLSKDFRAALEHTYTLVTLRAVEVKISQIDGTRKYLF